MPVTSTSPTASCQTSTGFLVVARLRSLSALDGVVDPDDNLANASRALPSREPGFAYTISSDLRPCPTARRSSRAELGPLRSTAKFLSLGPALGRTLVVHICRASERLALRRADRFRANARVGAFPSPSCGRTLGCWRSAGCAYRLRWRSRSPPGSCVPRSG
jgi:hypothetical protein